MEAQRAHGQTISALAFVTPLVVGALCRTDEIGRRSSRGLRIEIRDTPQQPLGCDGSTIRRWTGEPATAARDLTAHQSRRLTIVRMPIPPRTTTMLRYSRMARFNTATWTTRGSIENGFV